MAVDRVLFFGHFAHQHFDGARVLHLRAKRQPLADQADAIGGFGRLANPIGIGLGERQALLDEAIGREDAVLEGEIRERLAEEREPVAQADVVVVETRPVVERLPAPLGGCRRRVAGARPTAAPAGAPSAADVAVVAVFPAVLVAHRLGHEREPLLAQQVDDSGIGARMERW